MRGTLLALAIVVPAVTAACETREYVVEDAGLDDDDDDDGKDDCDGDDACTCDPCEGAPSCEPACEPDDCIDGDCTPSQCPVLCQACPDLCDASNSAPPSSQSSTKSRSASSPIVRVQEWESEP